MAMLEMKRRPTLNVAVLAAVAAALAGCVVGPDYKRPEVVAPGAFQIEIAKAEGSADAIWWRQFGDPVLDELIAEALAHNSNIAIATANVAQASAFLTQTRSQFFPQLGYGADAARQRAPEPDFAKHLPLAKVAPSGRLC